MSSDNRQRRGSGSGQPIRGVTHLVNPPEEDHEVISAEEDRVERDYLGRILHVADRALRHGKAECFAARAATAFTETPHRPSSFFNFLTNF